MDSWGMMGSENSICFDCGIPVKDGFPLTAFRVAPCIMWLSRGSIRSHMSNL